MATELGQLIYTLTLNETGFQEQLGSASGKVKEASGQMSGSLKETEKRSAGLKGAFSSMAGQFVVGAAVFTAGQKVFEGIKGAIAGGIDAAKEWQNQQAQLTAALKSTHSIAGVTKDDAIEYAEALSKSTPISREAALAGENMILTFVNIHKSVFPQTTKAVADMATAMNHGLTPSADELTHTAIMVGKALNDPEHGLTRLMRVGVAFTDQQKKQIKALQDSGNMAGAQKIILDELSKEFGGRATASAQTFTGQIQMLHNRFNDMVTNAIPKLQAALSSVGNFLMQHKVILASLTGVVAGLAIAIGVALVAALWAVVAPALAAVAVLWPVIAVGAAIGAIAYLIISNWNRIRPALEPVYQFFSANIMPIIRQIASFVATQFKQAWDNLKAAFDQLMTTLKPYEPELKKLAIVIGVTLLAPVLIFIGVLAGLIAAVVVVIAIFAKLISWVVKAYVAFTSFEVSVARSVARFVGAVAGGIGSAISWINSLPGKILRAVSGFGSLLYSAGQNIIKGLVNGISSIEHRVKDKISNVGKDIIGIAKKVLKIFSPSRVFDEDIGQQIPLGLAQGISRGGDIAVKATQQLTTQIIGAGRIPATAPVNAGSSIVGPTYNIEKVVLESGEAVDRFFDIANRNVQLEAGGLSPLAGTMGV